MNIVLIVFLTCLMMLAVYSFLMYKLKSTILDIIENKFSEIINIYLAEIEHEIEKNEGYLKREAHAEMIIKNYREYCEDIDKLLNTKKKPENICEEIKIKLQHIDEFNDKYGNEE